MEISIPVCVCKIAMKRLIDDIINAFRTCFGLSLVPSKLTKMKIPIDQGIIKLQPWAFIENSMSSEYVRYINSESLGTTVFWAPECTGKTFTLARIAEQLKKKHGFVYFDCKGIEDSFVLEKKFFEAMGLNYETDRELFIKFLSTYKQFITIVFDHFDTVSSYDFLTYLTQRSMSMKPAFNILVIVNNYMKANSLLSSQTGVLRFRLLGFPNCGRWSSNIIRTTNLNDNTRRNIDFCGTLMPIACENLPDDILNCQVSVTQSSWEKGYHELLHHWQRTNP
jgi:hypothetical protein